MGGDVDRHRADEADQRRPLSSVPTRSPGRPVIIPLTATSRQTIAAEASRTAITRSIVTLYPPARAGAPIP